MDCIRLRGRARYADVDSGPALFRAATHQESRIHVDGGDLPRPRHGSDYGGIQRDLCRADGPCPFPAVDRIVRMAVRTRAGSVELINLNPPQIQQLRQVRAIENMLDRKSTRLNSSHL